MEEIRTESRFDHMEAEYIDDSVQQFGPDGRDPHWWIFVAGSSLGISPNQEKIQNESKYHEEWCPTSTEG